MSNLKAYYTNISKNDLVISDIGVTIRAGQTINPFKLNPGLSEDVLYESEQIGGVHKAFVSKKLVKSSRPPQPSEQSSSTMTESSKPIPSRLRVGIALDPLKKQYIDDLIGAAPDTLERFEEFSEGFSEPDISFTEESAVEAEITPSKPSDRYVQVRSSK